MAVPKIYADLGDGLIMRAATLDDADSLARFNGKVHMHVESGTEAWWIDEWSRDLLTKPHPTLSPDDVIIVEDTVEDCIASSATYLTQQWSYDGIPFDVGRPETIGTAEEYRGRGLVRRQFDLMHRWSTERGHLVQVIDGIPFFYRQFGYEMAISQGGGRYSNLMAMPRWGKDEKRPFRMREPRAEDVAFITRVLNESAKRSMVSAVFKEDEVRYITFDRNERSAVAHKTGILCKSEGDQLGEPVGVIMYGLTLAIDLGVILRVEMCEPKYWRTVTPALLREFEEKARLAKDNHPDPEREIKQIRLDLEPDHPVFTFDEGAFGRPAERQYAWYARVPDIPAFINLIKRSLEARVESSIHAGLTAKLEVAFNRGGFVIDFEDGVNKSVKETESINHESASVFFTDLTFLQLLFGWRSTEDLLNAFPDCSTSSKRETHMLNTLFHKKSSDLSLTLA